MYSHRIKFAALVFFAGASIALACGPFFPWQLLDDRTATLKETPHNSFVYEIAHLVPPPKDRLQADEGQSYDKDQFAIEMHSAEIKGLSSAQASAIAVMRDQTKDDASAYAADSTLPEAIRLYTTGAIDFGAKNFDEAGRRFAAVLALPPKERDSRATWAAYMAGRSAALAADNVKAIRMFALTRKLALAGAPDPLSLAVASYGEQAKLHYDRANSFLITGGGTAAPGQPISSNPEFAGYTLPREKAVKFRGEMIVAAQLYAEQAARNSNSGTQSLRMIAQDVLADPNRIDAVVSSPILEQLVVDYVLARTGDDPGHDAEANDAGMGPPDPKPDPVLPVLVDAIVKQGSPNPAGADRLAALAYLVGRYDLAGKMADASSTPLAGWVKAKLALQKGDLAAAAAHYAQASKGFPRTDQTGSLDSSNTRLIVGESGTLALARGEYIDALDRLYPVADTYWGDVAYIAERVLTTDELKAFVDSKTSTPLKKPNPNAGNYGSPTDPNAQLRNLLARRLMRDGRYAVALDYFTDPGVRKDAYDYALALHEGETDWFPIPRAEGYFTAAKLVRASGLDIMGYEASPDYYDLNGLFDGGVGQDKPKGRFVTPAEQARAKASAAHPDLRFHYRFVAVDEASRAADLVPARSQAFAAMLCKANGWMQQTPGQQARAVPIYKRYVAQGARVDFAKNFGWKCPEPDFASAAALEHKQLYRHWRHVISRNRWTIAGTALLLVLGAIGAFVLLRRSRSA